MTLPVLVEQTDGTFTARLAGDPSLFGEAADRSTAIENLRAKISERLARGQLTFIDVPALMRLPAPGKTTPR
jgi:hypothetical protein